MSAVSGVWGWRKIAERGGARAGTGGTAYWVAK